MTRASTPRFDPYEELEVSRQATPEVIEAAYRALAKRHHPDVAAADDLERIKRLNEARDILLSPARRARYDGTSTVAGPTVAGPRPRPQVRRERRSDSGSTAHGQPAQPARPARASSAVSFGVHSRDVRQFLAELREIDGARAAAVLEARAAVDGAAYTEARTASLAASRAVRTDEWGFARDAASVIVRGKLDESPVARAVSGVVADVAGAIVVRDLLPPSQFVLLLEPWTRSKSMHAAIPARETATRLRAPFAVPGLAIPAQLRAAMPAQLRAAMPAQLRILASRRPVVVGILGSALALMIAVAFLGMGPDREAAVAGLTSAPTTGSVGLDGTPAASGPVTPIDPSGSPGWPASPGVPGLSASPTFDPTPLGPAPTLQPAPRTPRPTPIVTPRPTVIATITPTAIPSPTAAPTPTPSPSPSARVMCTVPDLFGVQTTQAQVRWAAEGFTGTVLFSPQPPPKYTIGWQSLDAGTDAPCTSDITVQPAAP